MTQSLIGVVSPHLTRFNTTWTEASYDDDRGSQEPRDRDDVSEEGGEGSDRSSYFGLLRINRRNVHTLLSVKVFEN